MVKASSSTGKRRGAPPKTARDRLVVRDYLTGKTLAEVALLYGVTRQRVQQIVQKSNVPRRRASHYQQLKFPAQRVLQLHRRGLFPKQIAAKLGWTRSLVLTRLAQSGVRPNMIQPKISPADAKFIRKIMRQPQGKRPMTVAQLREMFGVGHTTIYRVADGQIGGAR